jgi:hypothetical protein
VSTNGGGHLRPFIPSAADFLASTRDHFQFLVVDFGYRGPRTNDLGKAFEVIYDGPGTAVLLSWDVEGGYFACHLAPRLPSGDVHPDTDRWMSPNEVLAARGAMEDWVGQDDLEGADEAGFARTMERHAANLRSYCADVLRGDWSIYEYARGWLEHPDA